MNNIESLAVDYSIISEAFSNARSKDAKNSARYGYHSQMESDMIDYLDQKFPDEDYRKAYDELMTTEIFQKINAAKSGNARLEESYDLHQTIYELELSKPAEKQLIELTYAFDDYLIDLNDDYVEADGVSYIISELDLIKSDIHADSSIPTDEKQLLIAGIDTYSVNLPLLLDELAAYDTIEGRWLRRLLRQVVTTIIWTTVYAVAGAVLGTPVFGIGAIPGAISGAIIGFGWGFGSAFINDECISYVNTCGFSGVGNISCTTGACL
ncbi:MAG: hypothetical protein JJU23_12760 [Cyclobacteriaceae bacterium]|nr:hypothetical protein [Cyclobacteriaceae bacterium]